MPEKKSSVSNIIWAVDPFEGKLRPDTSEVESWMMWAVNAGIRVQPVYILALPPPPDSNGGKPQYNTQETANVDNAIRNYLREINCRNSLAPEVLVSYDSHSGAAVERLLRYASQIEATAILVSSRGRKGVDRFIFGSFAENLLFQSPLPIIFLTHNHVPILQSTQNKILFPTDFSTHSEKAFVKVLLIAKQCNAKVVLYHGVTNPISSANDEFLKWINLAKAAGVDTDTIVENVGQSSNVALSIIEVAKKQAVRFIAMASSSGKLESVFLGSVAREVFRTNLFSIMTYGPIVFHEKESVYPTP